MADRCDPIRAKIDEIRGEIRGLQGDLQDAGPSQKAGIASQIRGLQAELVAKQRELVVCKGGPPNVFVCDDGGVYYVRFIGDQVFWFGEHPAGGFANIFFGRMTGSDITGQWFDIPKGRTTSRGTIGVRLDRGSNILTRTAVTGGFGGARWTPFITGLHSGRVAGRGFRPAGFEATGSADLTGTWMGNDGGTYYLRQIDTRVIWFGESGGFSNLFRGNRSGNAVSGDWADVPKGGLLQSGTIAVAYDPATDTLARTAVTGGFGGTRWSRVQARVVNVNLQSLILHETEDVFGDEPYLWTVFVKVDGDTVDFANLGGSRATVVSTSGSQNNLTGEENIGSGRTLAIPPHVGRFGTVLKTIRGLPVALVNPRDATRLVMYVKAWDEDGLSNGSVEAGRAKLVELLQTRLETAIRAATAPDIAALQAEIAPAVEAAIAASDQNILDFVFGGGQDDQIGDATLMFSFADLAASGGRIPLNFRFTGDGADYELVGEITISG